ncbi:MAG: hypothetical protein JXR63_01840 [Spirochaetales bacterium]|nr:hypothetical protein [Spirochaetales bacterium]
MIEKKISLLANLPEINRARGYRIYDSNGSKIIDTYLDGGCFACGHRSENVGLSIKNEVSKGCLCRYPSIYTQKLIRHLRQLFPSVKKFYFFKDMSQLTSSLALPSGVAVESVFYSGEKNQIPIWRPFSKSSELLLDQIAYFIPNLPRSFDDFVLLCCNEEIELDAGEFFLSASSASSLIKNLSFLRKKQNSFLKRDYSEFDNSKVVFDGDYFFIKSDDYSEVFLEGLERGILLSPDPAVVNLYPLELSQGENDGLRKFLRLVK